MMDGREVTASGAGAQAGLCFAAQPKHLRAP
jgi:hypothetical protein